MEVSELLDVLNEKGEPTGVAKPRGEIHELGLFHRAIHCWIVNSYVRYFLPNSNPRKGEVLVQKRSHLKKAYPNLWDISSAGIDLVDLCHST
jgi:isopentenyldiphosphate isomerase